MKNIYRIAETTMQIASDAPSDVWTQLESNFKPFILDESEAPEAPDLSVKLTEGLEGISLDMDPVYVDEPQEEGIPSLYVYRDPEGMLYFRIIQPFDKKERTLLKLSPSLDEGVVFIERKGDGPRPWQAGASLTAALQIAYHMSAQRFGNLLSHASCVVKEGKAYLFLGKSGTGKSTHSRMWMEAFPDTVLLNDDHPILRFDSSGSVTSFGSPWSGKTPCYKNISAPVGGIVRISRGECNHLRRLSPIEAYASMMTSVFNAPFDPKLADNRHKWIEGIVVNAPCYELHCLPNADAARVCLAGMKNDQQHNK